MTTRIRSGTITAVTTGDLTNALAGSATACGTGAVVAVVFSILFPYKYTSSDPAHIARVEKIRGTPALQGVEVVTELALSMEPATSETKSGVPEQSTAAKVGTDTPRLDAAGPTGNDVVDYLMANHIEPLDLKSYHKARLLAYWACSVFFVFAIVLFPFTFCGTGYIFTKAAFTGWVVVSLMWVLFSALTCIIWPLVESYPTLKDVTSMLLRDTFHRKAKQDTAENLASAGQK